MFLNDLLFMGFLKPQSLCTCCSTSRWCPPLSWLREAPHVLQAQLVLSLPVSYGPLYRLSAAWIAGARLYL